MDSNPPSPSGEGTWMSLLDYEQDYKQEAVF